MLPTRPNPCLRSALRTLLFAIAALLIVGTPRAQDAAAEASSKVTELRQGLEAATELGDEERGKVETALSRAETQLAAESQYRKRLDELRTTIRGANSQINRIEGQLLVTPQNDRSSWYLDSVSAIETALGQAQAQANEAQDALERANEEQKRLETARSELPRRIEELRSRLEESKDADAAEQTAEAGASQLLLDAQAAARTAERLRRQAELAFATRQSQSLDLLTRLAKAQAKKEKASVEAANRRLEQLEYRLREARTSEVTERVKPARAEAEKAPEALKSQASLNLQFADALESAATDLGPALDARRRVERQLARVERDFREARNRVELVGLSQGVGQELRLLRARMLAIRSEAGDVTSVRNQIVQAYDARFRTEDQLQQLEDFDAAVSAALDAVVRSAGTDAPDRDALRSDTRDLLTTRLDLLQNLSRLQLELTNTLVATDSALTLLRESIGECLEFATERVMWVPSAPALWQAEMSQELRDAGETPTQLAEALWFTVRAEVFPALASSSTVWLLLAALLVLIALRRTLNERVAKASAEAARRSNTSIAPTLRAVAYLLLLAAALPIGIVLLSGAVDAAAALAPDDGSVAARLAAIGQGLRRTALIAFLLGFLRRSSKPGALLDVHLDWPAEACELLVRRLRWLSPILILTSLSLASINAAEAQVWTRSAGRLSLVIAAISVAVAATALLHPDRGVLAVGRDDRNPPPSRRFRITLRLLGIGIPLGLAGLSVAGFQFTALILWTRLLATIALLATMLLVRGIVVRWLLLAQRALAISRAREAHRARAAHPQASDGAGPEIPVDHAGDLATVDQQTETVVRVLIQLSALVGLWYLWIDVLPALGILEQFELWDEQVRITEVVTDADGTEELVTKDVIQPVTLERLLLAIVVLVATWFLARNAGGFLEVAILRHTAMKSGERYATRTIANYAVGLGGISLALSTIGLGWDKIQWLLAAVSVGLGFGLQEIFANFVSGLILLLERPIRVGDLVTVGETDGRVTRIQMRATTITDWDRKELVVPNREFITGRFVNWSLTNPLTRLVFPVGIAYGSDTRKAAALMEDAANECSVVMASPKPSVVFRGFGASSLDLELRVFIASMDDWLDAKNEVHRNIDDKLKEAGIEIAFPQQDLHVRDLPAAFNGPPTPPHTPVAEPPEKVGRDDQPLADAPR